MRIAALTLLLGSLGLAACNDNNDDVLVAPGSRSGTFVLQTVNGQALPATVFDTVSSSLTVEAVAGAIALGTNNSFVSVTDFRLSLGDIVGAEGGNGLDSRSTHPVICAGTFTAVADTLTFVEAKSSQCGRTFKGVLRDRTLTASLRGRPAVYAR